MSTLHAADKLMLKYMNGAESLHVVSEWRWRPEEKLIGTGNPFQARMKQLKSGQAAFDHSPAAVCIRNQLPITVDLGGGKMNSEVLRKTSCMLPRRYDRTAQYIHVYGLTIFITYSK